MLPHIVMCGGWSSMSFIC